MARTSYIRAVSTLVVREKSLESGRINRAEIQLEIGNDLDYRRYFAPDGKPQESAVRAYTACFVHGLIANLHYGHEMKFWDSAEHLRFIIAELERGFASVVKVGPSEPY